MNLMRKSRFLSIMLCLSIILYKTCAKTIPNTQDMKERTELSERDLLQNYETLWRNAVTRDTIISEMSSQKEKYVSINNGQDFNIPINDKIMSRPIGTYQYIDTDGHLHIVDYINGPNGLSILNDYKPYASLESKNIRSNDPNSKNLKNEIKGNEFSNEKYSVGKQIGETHKDINYDEFEFTFMPQEINKSIDNNNEKINVLNAEESNRNNNKQLSPNLESNNKFNQNNDNNYETIHRLTQLMNLMPLPQPFSLPNHSQPTLLQKIPEHINDYWRGTPSNQNNRNGMPTQGSPSNTQPFFNWNQNN